MTGIALIKQSGTATFYMRLALLWQSEVLNTYCKFYAKFLVHTNGKTFIHIPNHVSTSIIDLGASSHIYCIAFWSPSQSEPLTVS